MMQEDFLEIFKDNPAKLKNAKFAPKFAEWCFTNSKRYWWISYDEWSLFELQNQALNLWQSPFP